MMGINDVASTVQVNGFVQLLEQSRLVKLFNSLWKARVKETDSAAVLFMGQKIPKDRPDDDQRLKMAVTLAAQGKSKEAILFYTELIGRYKKYGNWPTMWFYRQIGEIYKRDQDTQSLIMTIGIIIKATPRDAWAIDNVQLLCQDGHEKTLILKTLEQAISENSREPALHQLAGSCYAAHNQMDLADGEFKKAQQLRADAINPITRNNYRKVIDLLNKQTFKLWLSVTLCVRLQS